MKSLAVGIALVFVCSISTVFAKGSGGHGSGGHGGHASGGHSGGSHGGGGHAGGGHAGGGHAAGGHATGGHASGTARGSTVSHGKSVARGSRETASTSSKSPTTARARDGRPITGTAVERTGPAPLIGTHPYVYVPAPYGFLHSSGALRFNAFNLYYDPFWAGYGYAPDPFDASGPTGGLRLKIQPKDAEVYVDGYYAGIVDDFDGQFQHLTLVPGPHRVEVRAPGYLTLVFDVSIQAHHTTEYRGVLQR